VIRKLRERTSHPIFVLATAYDTYAVEAFRLEALDLPFEDVEKERLRESIRQSQEFLESPTIGGYASRDAAENRR